MDNRIIVVSFDYESAGIWQRDRYKQRHELSISGKDIGLKDETIELLNMFIEAFDIYNTHLNSDLPETDYKKFSVNQCIADIFRSVGIFLAKEVSEQVDCCVAYKYYYDIPEPYEELILIKKDKNIE